MFAQWCRVCLPGAKSPRSPPTASSFREIPSLWTQDLVRKSKKEQLKTSQHIMYFLAPMCLPLTCVEDPIKLALGSFSSSPEDSGKTPTSLVSEFQILKLKGQSVGWEQQLVSAALPRGSERDRHTLCSYQVCFSHRFPSASPIS